MKSEVRGQTSYLLLLTSPHNMKKLILFIFIVILTEPSNGQITFQKNYGGANDDFGTCAQPTSDGGYIITGSTKSFGQGVYLIKTDSAGDTLWTKSIGTDNEAGQSVQQTSDGGYIISGTRHDAALGESFVYVIKLDSSGTILWRKCYEGGAGYSVRENNDKGFIICGIVTSGFSNYSITLIRTDSVGTALWIKFIVLGGGHDNGYAAQQTSDGGFIVTGTLGPSFYYAFLLKVNASGNVTWCKWFSAGTVSYLGQCVLQTSDGGYIIAGTASSNSTGQHPILIKTTSTGNVSWTKKYVASIGGEYTYTLQKTNDGGYVVACINYDWIANKTFPSIFKTDSTGTLLWSQQFYNVKAVTSALGFITVNQTMDGGYILCCTTDSLGAGGKDICMIKTDSTGHSFCNDSTQTLTTVSMTTAIMSIVQNINVGTAANVPPLTIGAGCMTTTNCYNNSTAVSTINENSTGLFVFPNPFSPDQSGSTTLLFSLPKTEKVSFKVFDVNGRLIKIIADGMFEKGENKIEWNAADVNAGLYFLRMETKGYSETIKLSLVK